MELQYYGANCVRLSYKKASVVIDDNLAVLGKKSVTKPSDIVLYTSPYIQRSALKDPAIVIESAGEYEVSGASIIGVAAQAHLDAEGKKAIIYRVILDDVRVAVIGHVHPELDEVQLEAIGTVDVLIVPVGGNGYTVDPVGAAKLVKKIDPKIIVPVHYDIPGIKYEVSQQPLAEALKVLAMEPAETTTKLKLKSSAGMPEVKQLIVVEPQV